MRGARRFAASVGTATAAVDMMRMVFVLQPTNSVWYSLPAFASDGSHADGVAERSGQWLAHFFCFKTGNGVA
jgi:hypothetical protein